MPLFEEFLEVLRAHCASQLEALRKRAKRQRVSNIDACSITDDDLVFRAPRSRAHMHNTAPRKALLKCLAKAGIERWFTVHGSRHTFNNLLRRTTKDGVLVRSLTGHATEETTDHYSDVELDEERQAVVGLTLIVGGKTAPRLSGNQSGNHAEGEQSEGAKT